MNIKAPNRLYTEVRIKNEHDTFWKQHQLTFFKQVQQEKLITSQLPANRRQFDREEPAIAPKEKDARENEDVKSNQSPVVPPSNLQTDMKEIDCNDESTFKKPKPYIQELVVTPEQSSISTPSILHSQIRKQGDSQKSSSLNIQASQKHEEQEEQQEIQEVEECSFYTIHDPSSSSLRNASSNQPPNEHHSQQIKLESIPNQLSIIINQQQALNQQNQPPKQENIEISSEIFQEDSRRGRIQSSELGVSGKENSYLLRDIHETQDVKEDYQAQDELFQRKLDDFINKPFLSIQGISNSNMEENQPQPQQASHQEKNQITQNVQRQENSTQNNMQRVEKGQDHYYNNIVEQEDHVLEKHPNNSREVERPNNWTIDQMMAQNEIQIDQIIDDFQGYFQSVTQNCSYCTTINRQNQMLKYQIQELSEQNHTNTTKSEQMIIILRKEREQSNKVVFELKAALQSLKEELANAKETVTVQTNITRTTSTKNIQTFNQSDEEEEAQSMVVDPIGKKFQQYEKEIDYESQKNSSDQEEEEASSQESSNIQFVEELSAQNTNLPHQKDESSSEDNTLAKE